MVIVRIESSTSSSAIEKENYTELVNFSGIINCGMCSLTLKLDLIAFHLNFKISLPKICYNGNRNGVWNYFENLLKMKQKTKNSKGMMLLPFWKFFYSMSKMKNKFSAFSNACFKRQSKKKKKINEEWNSLLFIISSLFSVWICNRWIFFENSFHNFFFFLNKTWRQMDGKLYWNVFFSFNLLA